MKSLPRLRSLALLLPLLLFTLAIPNPASAQPFHSDLTNLPSEVRAEMTRAAQDTLLPAWQRDFMVGLARTGRVQGTAGRQLETTATEWDATTDGSWQALFHTARIDHAAIYDPVRNRVLTFGGYKSSRYWNDVWALSLSGTPVWMQLTPTGTPPAGRACPSAVYDPVRDRMVIFGGHYDDVLCYNDVWALSLSGAPAWTQLTPTGTPPTVRRSPSAIYDPVRDQMVVFGGVCTDASVYLQEPRFNDVWALSLSGTPAWTQLAPAGALPSARRYHSAIHDPVRDRMVMFGGDISGSATDVWTLSLGDAPAWTQLATTGTPPDARIAIQCAIYDPVRDRMLAFVGGVWELSLGDAPAWAQLTAAGAAPGTYGRAMYDAALDRMVVLEEFARAAGALSLADAPAWTNLTPATLGLPYGRYHHSQTYDPVRDRMIVFGGWSSSEEASNLVWVLSLSGAPLWTQPWPTGTPPSPRRRHTAIYDPPRDRLIVFGGAALSSCANDVWALSLGDAPAWTQLAPPGTLPSGRQLHSAIYDPVRDRMVVFGGYDYSNYFDDVWALSLGGTPAWTRLAPAGTSPSARCAQGAICDPVRDRMVVFGGTGSSGSVTDVWSLSLGDAPAWARWTPTGTPDTAWWPSAVYDPLRDRVVVWGGWSTESYLPVDTWSLSLGDAPAWTQLEPNCMPPGARSDHNAIYDPLRDRMLVFGGRIDYPYGNDTWALNWSAPELADVACPGDGVWMAGASVPFDYNITNPYAFDEIADYTLTSGRDWPGFPITGSVTVGAGGTTTVPIEVPVPDTAASGANTLMFVVTLRSVPQYARCSHDLRDATVPVQLTLVSAEAEPDLVRLTWYAAAGAVTATVYRRTEASEWRAVGAVSSDGTGQLVYEDRAVTPGTRYGYRLGVMEDGAETFVGEAWVDVPLAAQLALAGARPNPALRELAVAFTLPDGSPARLEAYDLVGRRVAARDVGSLGPGGHTVKLGEGKLLGCGVYLVRLTQAGRTLTTRAVIVR